MEEFTRNICRIVGHEWRSHPDIFADICARCSKWNRHINIWNARNLLKVETLQLGSEPIYDKDIPDEDA